MPMPLSATTGVPGGTATADGELDVEAIVGAVVNAALADGTASEDETETEPETGETGTDCTVCTGGDLATAVAESTDFGLLAQTVRGAGTADADGAGAGGFPLIASAVGEAMFLLGTAAEERPCLRTIAVLAEPTFGDVFVPLIFDAPDAVPLVSVAPPTPATDDDASTRETGAAVAEGGSGIGFLALARKMAAYDIGPPPPAGVALAADGTVSVVTDVVAAVAVAAAGKDAVGVTTKPSGDGPGDTTHVSADTFVASAVAVSFSVVTTSAFVLTAMAVVEATSAHAAFAPDLAYRRIAPDLTVGFAAAEFPSAVPGSGGKYMAVKFGSGLPGFRFSSDAVLLSLPSPVFLSSLSDVSALPSTFAPLEAAGKEAFAVAARVVARLPFFLLPTVLGRGVPSEFNATDFVLRLPPFATLPVPDESAFEPVPTPPVAFAERRTRAAFPHPAADVWHLPVTLTPPFPAAAPVAGVKLRACC
jgi:hypothetical protein